MTATEPPVRGDHRSTWTAIAAIAFLLAAVVLLAASLGGQAGLW